MGREEYDNAIRQFQEVLKLNPSNKAATNAIIMAKHKLKQNEAKVRDIYAGMFQKFADEDTQVLPLFSFMTVCSIFVTKCTAISSFWLIWKVSNL